MGHHRYFGECWFFKTNNLRYKIRLSFIKTHDCMPHMFNEHTMRKAQRMQENGLYPNVDQHMQAFPLFIPSYTGVFELGVYFMEMACLLCFHVNVAVTNKGNKETPAL